MLLKITFALLLSVSCKARTNESSAKEVHNANVFNGISTVASSDTIGTLVNDKQEITLIRCPFRSGWGWPKAYTAVEPALRSRPTDDIRAQLATTECRGLMMNASKISFVTAADLPAFKQELAKCIAPALKNRGGELSNTVLFNIDPNVWVDSLLSQPGSRSPALKSADSYSYNGAFIDDTEKCVISSYAKFLEMMPASK